MKLFMVVDLGLTVMKSGLGLAATVLRARLLETLKLKEIEERLSPIPNHLHVSLVRVPAT
jgi:hypothetical protein